MGLLAMLLGVRAPRVRPEIAEIALKWYDHADEAKKEANRLRKSVPAESAYYAALAREARENGDRIAQGLTYHELECIVIESEEEHD